MTDEQVLVQRHTRLRNWLGTLAIFAVYAAVMLSTNTHFTILDDEADSIAIAGRPLVPALRPFFTGVGFHELHPPAAEILLHYWLLATHYSFFLLRVFANIFYIAAIFFTAKSAARIAGKPAYWTAMCLGLAWPFAFQYGRIAGWYCVSMFLLSWVTWEYLSIVEKRGYKPWTMFGVASVLLVWSNYFGFAFLFLLLADLLIFQRDLARNHLRSLWTVIALVAMFFLPLLPIALHDVFSYVAPIASRMGWKNEIAVIGYPSFAIFGSAAIAPWYLPLSLPVFLSVPALIAAVWFSRGRHWLVYAVLSMALLYISGNLDIKRVPFVLPWLFLAMAAAASGCDSRYPRLALSSLAVIVVCGWIGIVSGKHYATANLYEPWGKVADVVAQDARRGATIVSANPPFFLYLDYQLGVQADTAAADSSFLPPQVYRSRGYDIRQPHDWQKWAGNLHGEVVMVNGSGVMEQVEEQSALSDALRLRCSIQGEYHAAPDPAAMWKAQFVKGAPMLAYRTNVIWYDCPR
ncbi:MAG: glycosyltransferase family 39 protein [Terracidiphilus sp.]